MEAKEFSGTDKALKGKEFDVKRLIKPSLIGEGATAFIYRTQDANSEKIAAVKIYKPDAEKLALKTGRKAKILWKGDWKELVEGTRDYEAAVMEHLRSAPYVARLEGIINGYVIENGAWVPKKGAHGLVREWAEGTPLHQNKETYSNPDLLMKVFTQYLGAMMFAASKEFSFEDIKPEDVVVDLSKQTIGIVDLNLAKQLPKYDEDALIRLWNRDLLALEYNFFKPADFTPEGIPVFNRIPVENLMLYPQGSRNKNESLLENILREEKNPLYGINPRMLFRISNYINFTIPALIEKARQRETRLKELGLDVSSPENFLNSLKANPDYQSVFEQFAEYGEAMNSGSSLLWVNSQLAEVAKRLGLGGGRWQPHELAALAFKLSKGSEGKN